jgi:type IV secretory pathway VirJ component
MLAAMSGVMAATPRPSLAHEATRLGHWTRNGFVSPTQLPPLRLATAAPPSLAPGIPNETLSHGRFKSVAIYRPVGEVKQFVLFLSGHSGWNGTAALMADALADEGAMVAGIDTPQLFAAFKRDGDECVFPDGDLENLSHFIQAYYKVPTYLTPVIAGYSAGATLASTMAQQSASGIFAGALALGSAGKFQNVCAKKAVAQPRVETIALPETRRASMDRTVWMPQIKGALARITGGRSERLPPPPKSLEDLPVIEVPSTSAGEPTDLFAVLLSGDGGWAGLDRELAQALAARGVPVAGLDSLRYFWTPRTPQSVSQDIDRTLRYYASHWGKSRALLIGYSQGADVMPFALNRLPAATRQMVSLTTLLGMSDNAMFEFHLTNWIASGREGLPVRPEIEKLSASEVLCIYGTDDDESTCSKIDPAHARVLELPGGHHFDGDYGRVASLILDQVGFSAAATAASRGP